MNPSPNFTGRFERIGSQPTHAWVFVDFSAVTAFRLSSELIRQLAQQEPCMPDPASRPRVIVAPTNHEFGLARMFQILGESARPLLSVVHTLDEALAPLGTPFAHLEP
jgi:hypothetical protein